MNQWLFVIAAYGATLLGVGGLLVVTLGACRRAERQAEGLGRRE